MEQSEEVKEFNTQEPVIKELPFTDELTDEEVKVIALDAASTQEQIASLEVKKKSNNDYFNEEIRNHEGLRNKLLSQVKTGTKDITVECEIIYHFPEDGKKTVKRLDNGLTTVEEMTDYDLNLFPGEPTMPDLKEIYGVSFDDLDTESAFVVESLDDLEKLGYKEIDNELLESLKGRLVIRFESNEKIQSFIKLHLMNREVGYSRLGNDLALAPLEKEEGAQTC